MSVLSRLSARMKAPCSTVSSSMVAALSCSPVLSSFHAPWASGCSKLLTVSTMAWGVQIIDLVKKRSLAGLGLLFFDTVILVNGMIGVRARSKWSSGLEKQNTQSCRIAQKTEREASPVSRLSWKFHNHHSAEQFHDPISDSFTSSAFGHGSSTSSGNTWICNDTGYGIRLLLFPLYLSRRINYANEPEPVITRLEATSYMTWGWSP